MSSPLEDVQGVLEFTILILPRSALANLEIFFVIYGDLSIFNMTYLCGRVPH